MGFECTRPPATCYGRWRPLDGSARAFRWTTMPVCPAMLDTPPSGDARGRGVSRRPSEESGRLIRTPEVRRAASVVAASSPSCAPAMAAPLNDGLTPEDEKWSARGAD